MFKNTMTVNEMDKVISEEYIVNGTTLIELVKILGIDDLKIYLDIFKQERNVTDADFIWINKVGANAFHIASELQFRY